MWQPFVPGLEKMVKHFADKYLHLCKNFPCLTHPPPVATSLANLPLSHPAFVWLTPNLPLVNLVNLGLTNPFSRKCLRFGGPSKLHPHIFLWGNYHCCSFMFLLLFSDVSPVNQLASCDPDSYLIILIAAPPAHSTVYRRVHNGYPINICEINTTLCCLCWKNGCCHLTKTFPS